ncbi:TRAP transporter small permease [Paracoccus aurantiacus]|uniref:TRAP transporter small permease protein n=1 Tax=Paracoccus aurantiacus TaxID=2599412 RepID=A0A5C6RZ99_9RHOB|nr:TRAP transporter small permease [Paracoccus aurantiacus]TXB67728.1 TRAP transporter small permease [Paracoccus aurantiacus]
MDRLFEYTGYLSWLLVSVAKVMIGVVILLVIADVAARNFGLRAMTWAISATEYSLLYITFLSMPWLVRIRGHVFVTFLRALFPPKAQRLLETLVYLTCLGLCLYLGYVAFDQMMAAIAKRSFESRTFDMPKWAIYLPVFLGFALSAVEWLRFLLAPVSIYDAGPLDAEGL